mgnify:CR=1 FL=1|nr:NusG domain II-containing protein [uncultured Sellimonas sp.]
MKKGDWILIILILSAACAGFFLYSLGLSKDAGEVHIYVNGDEKANYSLSEDRTVKVNSGTNVVEIRDGKVKMKEADCPDQICVRHKEISKNGEQIICLPNKVVVSVGGGKESDVDTVVN